MATKPKPKETDRRRAQNAGDTFLALGANHWGTGTTPDAATRRMRKAGFRGRSDYVVVEIRPGIPDDGLTVCQMFGPSLPRDTAVRVVVDKRRGEYHGRNPWPDNPVLED